MGYNGTGTLAGRVAHLEPELQSLVPVFLKLAIAVSIVAAPALDYVSSEPAQQLKYFFQRTGRNSVAAVDEANPGSFIAAIHVAGDHLVVRARHPDVQRVTTRIDAGEHFQTYLDLIATPTPAGKLFVMDAGANGVLSGMPGADNIDLIRADEGRQIVFNGDFAGQQLTAPQYDAQLAQTDAEYARLLKVLLSSVR
jgi:hypothetical protein